MSNCGETVNFYATSLGRNHYLQAPTGLFGGDPSVSVGTVSNPDYETAPAYREVVVTADGRYHRAPVACWYAMGQGVVRDIVVPPGGRGLRLNLAWTVTAGLWSTIRVPGQVLTFTDNGVLVHGRLQDATTDALAVVDWDATTTALRVGDRLPYMVRQRAPRGVLLGPVQMGPDARTIRIQGNPLEAGFVAPQAKLHLLYAGRRSDHPTQPCALDDDPGRARNWIFGVDEVRYDDSGTRSLVSTLQRATTRWVQASQWHTVVSVVLPNACVATGMHYRWPYPATSPGTVWLLLAAAPRAQPTDPPPLPTLVYFVRVAVDSGTAVTTAVVNGLTLNPGDRLVRLQSGVPTEVVTWDGVALVAATDVRKAATLVVVEADTATGASGRAWWLSTAVNAAWEPYTVAVCAPHPRGQSEAWIRGADAGTTVATDHAFVLLTRRSDMLFPYAPVAVASNLSNVSPVDWTWTYPLTLADDTDRFDPAAVTDGLLGVPVRNDPLRGLDFACLRRRLGPRPLLDPRPPEYLRLNLDLGAAVAMQAFAWGLVADGAYPTLTLHGSNDAAFFVDQMVSIPTRVAAGIYSRNTHVLAGGTLLWQLTFDQPGSAWTAADVAAGTADIFITRLAGDPRYTRLQVDGRNSGPLRFTDWETSGAHVFPTQASTPAAFRYYALTLSVGLTAGSAPLWVELQEFQPLTAAPDATGDCATELYGRGALPPGTGVYTIRLSKPLPTLPPTGADGFSPDIGYVEVWDSFKVRTAYHQGQAWSQASFPAQPGMGGTPRRASASLSDVLLPRTALVRSVNTAVTGIPFLWCFVRHRAMTPVSDQAAIAHRLHDPDRALPTALQPPAWTLSRDTLAFQLPVAGARIPGESRYIGLNGSNVVQVLVTDTVGSSLPELCLVLPSGEVLDFIEYDANIPLPAEVMHDEWSAVNAMLSIQFEEPPPKRARGGTGRTPEATGP